MRDRSRHLVTIGEAAAMEHVDPRQAERHYATMEQENLGTYPAYFLLAGAAPVLAMLAAYVVAPRLPFDRALSTAAIVLLAGYLPPAILFGNRVIASGGPTVVSLVNRDSGFSIAVGLLFEGPLWLLTIWFFFVIAAVPVLALVAAASWMFVGPAFLDLAPWLLLGTLAPLLVVTVVFVLSGTSLRALRDLRRGITDIGSGLRTRLKDGARHLVGFAFLGMPVVLVYDRLDLALSAAAACGVLLGLATFRIPHDGQEDFLIGLGRARCDVRLARLGSARYRLHTLDEKPETVKGRVGPPLISSVGVIANPPRDRSRLERMLYKALAGVTHSDRRLERMLDEALATMAHSDRRSEFEASIAATRRLAEAVEAGELPWVHDRDETVVDDIFGIEDRGRLFERAVAAEARDPTRALELYRRVQAANTGRYPLVLVTPVVALVLASVAAYQLAQLLPIDPTVVTVVVIFLLGYLPSDLMWARQAEVATETRSESAWERASSRLVGALADMFDSVAFAWSTVWIALPAILVVFGASGVICHIVVGTPWLEPPLAVTIGPVHVLVLISGLIVAADATDYVGLRLIRAPRDAITEILVGLRAKGSENLRVLASLGIGALIVGAGPLGLLFENPGRMLLAAGVAGLLLGLSLWKTQRSQEWTMLIWLGFGRCELLRGRAVAAHWWVTHTTYFPQDLAGDCGRRLTYGLVHLVQNHWHGEAYPGAMDDLCDDVAASLDVAQDEAHTLPLAPQWHASIDATRRVLDASRSAAQGQPS